MGKFLETNTPRERLICPTCKHEFYVFKHKKKKVVCPNCDWSSSFRYPDEEE